MRIPFGREFAAYMRDKNNSDVRLIFEEMSENNEMNVDTENARVYHTEIYGKDAIVSIKEKHLLLYGAKTIGFFRL